MPNHPMPREDALASLKRGVAIPAHPLALTREGKLDERRQRALTRYYLAAGARGVAVGVHTTQFEIRDPKIGLFQPVLEIAAKTVAEFGAPNTIKIAGVCGNTAQAIKEAGIAVATGYDIALLSLAALGDASDDRLIEHCCAVAEVIPLMGFYMQTAVGGRVLSCDFWRRFAEIPNVVAIKMAPFNRYHMLDVIKGVAASGRANEIALYTGNDDNIICDLLTTFRIGGVSLHIAGGLLGHWSVWTKRAVELLARIRSLGETPIPQDLLTIATQVTDCNAAFFDAANNFSGCIAGIHEILMRQGLLASRRTLNGKDLSPGQLEEIDRVCHAYPQLSDDRFVAEHLDEWLN